MDNESKKTVVISLAILLLFSALSKIQAQQSQPQFFVTWQATQNYAPSGFAGKILPTPGSRIDVYFDLIDAGKIQNLSKQTVYWYLDDGFLAGGAGMQNISLTAPETTSGFLTLRIQLPNYGSGLTLKTIQIPVTTPRVIIEAPYPGGFFNGASVGVSAIPYFFNATSISRLNFIWSVNGQTPPNTENPYNLTVNVNPDAPSGSSVNIGVAVQNPKFSFETASDNTNLILK